MLNKLRYKSILFCLIWLCSGAAFSLSLSENIQGIDGAPLENVENRLKSKLPEQILTPEQIQLHVSEAATEIKHALQPFGYFKATVKTEINNSDESWSVTYVINPGPALKVAKLDFQISGEGKNFPAFKNFSKYNLLDPGGVLNTQDYKHTKQSLLEAAERYGFLAAKITTSKIKIDLEKYTAKIILYFDTGPRYRFGDIAFSKTVLNEKFLRKFLTFKKSDQYDSIQIQDLQQNLRNSDLFQAVRVISKLEKPKNHKIPVEVNLTTKKNLEYKLGAGIGTDTGPRGMAGIQFHNITDTGQHFQTTLQASQIATNLSAVYTIYGKNPITDQYNFSANIATSRQDFGDSQTETLAASYLTSFRRWQQTVKLTFMHEEYDLDSEPNRYSTLLIPSINWLTIKANDPIRPTKGKKLNLNFQGANRAVLASTNFFISRIDGKIIRPLTKYQMLVARATLGYAAVDNVYHLPLTLQFRTGGSHSIRGFSFEKIGSGRLLAVGSLELRQKIYGNWYLAAFYDAGSAGFVEDGNNHFQVQQGAGLGVVWLSPIGAIQLSYAKALTKTGMPGMLQFSMGPEL